MTPILILVAFLALATGYFAGRFTARSATDARSAELQRALQDMQTQKAVAEARLQAERVQAAEAARRQAEELKKEFHAIASDLARTESESLQHRHTEALRALLHPFDADLKRFYDRFTEGNVAMRTNIEQLIRQTQTVGKQAEELTRALRGNTKVQGNWGEGILADLLEASGLRIGQEYDTQVNVKDVVVHLPDKRELIIDAKVSLSAYVNYVNAEDEVEQARFMKEHLQSVRKHIAELSAKRYDKLVPGAIGYVLLFIPNEAAYVAAVSSAPDLSMEAYRKQIILINPTNLLMALQLTYNLWQSEKQSANVRDIYASAEKLYNKFTLFAESFAKLGDNLQTLSTTYEEAQKRLTTGRGNIISRLESWREKGLTPARSMPDALLDATADDDEA